MFDNSDEKNKKGYITLSDLQSILFSAFSMKPEEVEKIFKEINVKNDNQITYGKKNCILRMIRIIGILGLKYFLFAFNR